MKAYLVILMMWTSSAFCQCYDIYGKKVNCPNMDDSLIIYHNALKVFEFYNNNKSYKKLRTIEVKTDNEKRDVYEMLESARNSFYAIRKEFSTRKIIDTSNVKRPKYIDITYDQYYHKIDGYRFYQRELENQIINSVAPISIYDFRIIPFVVNEYKCVDSTSSFFGDLVNLPLYLPVMVKPVSLLTPEEIIEKNELLHIEITKSLVPTIVNTAVVEIHQKKSSSIGGTPVYLYNRTGSSSIIGFLDNRIFRKIRPEEYKEFVVMKYAQEFLQNNDMVEKFVKSRYGEYYVIFD